MLHIAGWEAPPPAALQGILGIYGPVALRAGDHHLGDLDDILPPDGLQGDLPMFLEVEKVSVQSSTCELLVRLSQAREEVRCRLGSIWLPQVLQRGRF